MGIRGLYSYVIRKSEESFEPFILKNTKIIIDGRSLSYQLFDFSQRNFKLNYIIGGDYEAYSRIVLDFFQKLITNNVEFLLVINGCFRPEHQKKIEQKYTSLSSTLDFNPRRSGVHYAIFKDDIFMSVIKKLKIKFVKTIFDADEIISVASKVLNYPILTGNSDYILYGNDCILIDTIEFDKLSLKLSTGMKCKIYRSDKFIKTFPGLDVSSLSLLSMLMDIDNINDELLKKFLNFKSLDNETEFSHNKIQAILNWLSDNTLQSAAEAVSVLLTPERKSPKPIQKLIEVHINKYTTFSRETLKYLVEQPLFEITEKQISAVKDKFFKFTIKSKKPMSNEVLRNKLVERESDILKKNIVKSAPIWLLRLHSRGQIHSFIISMIGLQTFIPWYYLEHLEYPSVSEISMPLIKLIYELVSSCLKKDLKQPLKLLTRKKSNVYYEQIEVNSCPGRLETLKNFNIKERLKVINDVLKVADSENFRDLPKNWHLYIATIIFWFKQNVEPKKNKNHLKALLLAMFIDVIKNLVKIKGYKLFVDHYKEAIEKIMSTNISHKNQKNKMTTIQAIKNINRNDALMTANYMVPLISNRSKIVKPPGHTVLSTTTIHIYSQFETCLNFSRTLNALLNFPYQQTIIEQLLMRPLIYNLYMDMSQCPDVDGYISEKLKYAPTVLESFKILLKKVDLLLTK